MSDETVEEVQEVDPQEEARQEAIKAGSWVFLMLAILTVGEFTTAVIAAPWTFVLWLVAIWKAYYVIKDYMHIGRLFKDEETH